MKAARERLRTNLTISTKGNNAAGIAGTSGKQGIQTMTESDFAKRYRLKGQVMESTNTGMEVLFAARLSDNLEVVIKTRERSKSFKGNTEEREWRATTEVQMNMPRIATICQFLEVIETKDYYYIVMEKVQGRDLFEQLHRESIKPTDAREIVKQILQALIVFHSTGRIHKDLKLENVMVDLTSANQPANLDLDNRSPATVKLIDFDTVQDWEPTSPKTRDVLGTDGYIAPEAYGGEYSPASDIYCVGVILYKLITRKFPSNAALFDDLPGENWVGSPAMKRIQDKLRSSTIDFKRPPFDRMPVAADLAAMMLQMEPQDRPSSEDALKHSWFEQDLECMSPLSPTRRSREDRWAAGAGTNGNASPKLNPKGASSPKADKAKVVSLPAVGRPP